ncbi:MAG: hypothetical protein AAF962_18665 [Actinomycetota bacterium]
METLIDLIRRALEGDEAALAQLSESSVDTIDATLEEGAGDVDPLAVLADALAGSELDAATQASVLDAATNTAGGYTPVEGDGYDTTQLADIFAQGINVTLEEGDYITIDNSAYADGTIKGGIHQANYTDVTEADDGSVIADGAYDSNFQTGEGNVQLTDVHADNITTGDNNTVASDYATIGNENVDAGYIENSEFGEGDQDRSVDVDVAVTDSGNYDSTYTSEYTNDDYVNTEVDIDAHDGGYKPVKPVEHHDDPYVDDHHDDEVYD